MKNPSVGYKRPPKANQFKPGHSGNPKGRPKKKKRLIDDIDRALSERVTVVQDGKKKTLALREIVAKKLARSAAGGDLKATSLLLALQRNFAEPIDIDIDTEPLSVADEAAAEEVLAAFVARVKQGESK